MQDLYLPVASACTRQTGLHFGHGQVNKSLVIFFATFLPISAGCGGGDDFSKPPENLAAIRSKSKASQEKSVEPEPNKPAVQKAAEQNTLIPVDSAMAASADSSTEPDAATVPAAETELESSKSSTDQRDPAKVAAIEGEAVTAGGKTEAGLKADKKENESVASAGMSLLDKLKAGDGAEKKPGAKPSARRVIARTGRFAVAAETWFRLRNQLAKRFYVAATSSGSRIAASSGERSVGVLSTQVEVLGDELSWSRNAQTVAAVVTEKKEITTQPVSQLPGIVSSVELIQDGDVVLIGTVDGRLLARSCATLQGWDVYAQDLFAWQDERRPATRIADTAVIVVRALSDERLLTIAENGDCSVWKTAQVVHPPISPLKMTEEQARSPEAAVLTADPEYSVALPKSRVLSVAVSDSGAHCSIVTSDEQVTVIKIEDGHIVDTISAAQLDDTQPVVSVIEEQQKRILVGLADGRIFRRAIVGGEAVSGVDNEGNPVDYETVFAPDLGDRSGAITAMEMKHDGKVLYFGRLNGFVSQFDVPRKQLQGAKKQHNGPVIEIRNTPAGTFTIGDDRIAKLIDTPQPAGRGPVETFKLSTDRALKSKELIEPDETIKKDKFTVRRNFDDDVTDAANAGIDLVGIRSADPIIALYEHQLRVATGAEQRKEIRQKLFAARQESPRSVEPSASGQSEPLEISELHVNFDFQSRPLRRVVMAVSNDGTTVAASQYYSPKLLRSATPDQPVIVWDTITHTRLRAWRRSAGVYDLDIDMNSGILLPQPFSARMQLLSGGFLPEERPGLSSQRSANGSQVLVGLMGQTGSASPVLSLRSVDSHEAQLGVEAFEGAVPAVAWSNDGSVIYASVRERTQTRLLELGAQSLRLQTEIVAEPMSGQWDVKKPGFPVGILGATKILPSPTGKLLVTYGQYEATASPYQLRIWKKAGDRWPQDQVTVLDSKMPLLETEMTDTSMMFVNQQDTFLAMIGSRGVALLNTRTGDLDQTLELPNVGTRRPVTLLSPDGKLLLAGDREGNLWIWSLRSLKRKPRQIAVQAGPITGLAMSANSRFLATAGEENRIRVWDMSPMSEVSERMKDSEAR